MGSVALNPRRRCHLRDVVGPADFLVPFRRAIENGQTAPTASQVDYIRARVIADIDDAAPWRGLRFRRHGQRAGPGCRDASAEYAGDERAPMDGAGPWIGHAN